MKKEKNAIAKKENDKERNLVTLDFRLEPTTIVIDKKTEENPDMAKTVLKDCMSKLTGVYNDLNRLSYHKWQLSCLLERTVSKDNYLKKYNQIKADIKNQCEKKKIPDTEVKWPKIYWSEVDPMGDWLMRPRMLGWHQRLHIVSIAMPYNMVLNTIKKALERPPKQWWTIGPVMSITQASTIISSIVSNPVSIAINLYLPRLSKFEIEDGSLVTFPGKFFWIDKASRHLNKPYNFSQANNNVGEEIYNCWKSFFELKKNPKVKNRRPGLRESGFLTNINYKGSTKEKNRQLKGITLVEDGKEWEINIAVAGARPDKVTHVSGRLVGFDKHQQQELFDFKKVKYSQVKILVDSRDYFHCQLVIDTDKNNPESLPQRWRERMTPDNSQPKTATKAAIDLGMKNIMSVVFDDCSQYIYTGRQLYASRYYWLHKRAETQKTKGKIHPDDECHMKDKEFADNFFHQISNHLIKLCKEKGVKEIVMGDLTNIRHNKNGNDPSQQKNKYLKHSWCFAKLQEWISYKADMAKIKVRKVSEAFTSQKCCACGVIHKPNRGHVKDKKRYTPKKNGEITNRGNYHCFSDGNGGAGCGREFNSDLNGGVNIFADNYGFNPWKARFENGEKTSMTGIPGEAFIVRWERLPGKGAGLTVGKIS